MRSLLTVIFFLSGFGLFAEDSWTDVITKKKGTLTFYWYPNNISTKDSRNILDGIEHDLALSFVTYLEKEYQVQLDLQWVELQSFSAVLNTIADKQGGAFGASSISITNERQTFLNFTAPYIADIAVLVSNGNIPLAQTAEEFDRIFNNKKAITIRNTTLSSSIDRLAHDRNLRFTKKFVGNSGDIISNLKADTTCFGYIDLPNFLIGLDKNSNVRRQFFYPVKLQGLAFIYPKESDWELPVSDYFNSEQFELDKINIITKHLGAEVTDAIRQIAKSAELGPLEEIVISNRERELQYEELLKVAEREKLSIRNNTVLVAIITLITFLLIVLYLRYRLKLKTNQDLIDQQRVIEERNQQLHQLNQEKNELIRLLAHDLRSPLSRVLGISQLFKARKIVPKEQEHLNNIMVESSRKMHEMIAKILDVDAIESGKYNLHIEIVDLNQVVQSVSHEYQQQAEQKQINVVTELGESVKAMADKFYTSQVIDNLVSNAIKFSNPEQTITLKTDVHEEFARIAISDEGPGLSEEDERKIFKKYQTLSAKPTAGEGSVGLGLNIVKQYTELMGGKISYETELGKGTTFFIDFLKA